MKKQHLLPHAWQWVGLVALVVGIVLSIVIFVPLVLRGNYGMSGRMTGIEILGELSYFLLLPLSAIILCFSREKIEDERIAELRMKSLATTAIIFVILLIIAPIESFFIARLCSPSFMGKYQLLLGHSWWMLFVYLLIFKISYWVQNKRYSDEK